MKPKKMKISSILKAFLLQICLIIVACAPEPIYVESIDGYKEIKEGEDARLEWSFRNAEAVRIEGIAGTFAPKGFIQVKPSESIKYNIIAYHKGDSLIQTIRVKVIKDESSIQRGPSVVNQKLLYKSISEGEFLNGLLSADSSKGPVRLKIVRTIYPSEKDPDYKFRALLLDQFGNNITGYTKSQTGIRWSSKSDCDPYKFEQKPEYAIESEATSKNNVDLGILLDNSEVASENKNVIRIIKECIPNLSNNDNFLFSIYNHNLIPLIGLSSLDKAAWDFERLSIPDTKGLCAVYKSAYRTIEQLNAGSNTNKVLVIITYYSDNASVTIDASDVEELAKKSNIPIYIIGIGDALTTYQYKYLSSVTGSRFYHLDYNQTKYIEDILREITLSQKIYYEVAFANQFQDKDCSKFRTELKFSLENNQLADDYNYISKPSKQFSQYQALSVFYFKDSTFNEEFLPILTSVATLLNDNPTAAIELIGNSSTEDFDDNNVILSLSRAEIVKSKLLSLGAAPSQIKTKGIGFRKPLYYFEKFPWQGFFNRRVEIKWIDPHSMPYEIIAENFPSELEAENNITVWEKRGFKAYFERAVEKDNIAYRIKLWGYSTLETAERTAAELSKKYKQKFVVE